MKEALSTVKKTFSTLKGPIMMFIGIFCIIVISFMVGVFYGQKWRQKPLVLNCDIADVGESDASVEAKNESLGGSEEDDSNVSTEKSCLFIGSKTGSKYYPPTCSFASRIKPENLRCFSSDEDAVGKGYERSTAC